MWPFKWRLLSIFLWFLSSIVCVYFAASWVRIFWGDSHPNYLFFCLVGIVLVLAVFKAWRDCPFSFTLEFQHRSFHFGLEFLAEISDSESELSFSMMRNITNKRAEIELQSRSKYVLTTHLELSLKPAPPINFQLPTKTLLSCRTFSTVYRIISKISLRRKKSNFALSLKWNGTASNSNITDKSPDGYMVVKQYVSDDFGFRVRRQ